MDKLNVNHFSIGDWDYEPGAEFYTSTTYYVSEPSSLARPLYDTSGPHGWVYLKQSISGNLLGGALETYRRFTSNSYANLYIFVRSQDTPTNLYPANCYFFLLSYHAVYLYKRVNSYNTQLETSGLSPNDQPNTWCRYRCFFFRWWDTGLTLYLRFVIYRWVDSAWVNILQFDTTDPFWEDSSVNRIGLSVPGSLFANRSFIDDTIVWRQTGP